MDSKFFFFFKTSTENKVPKMHSFAFIYRIYDMCLIGSITLFCREERGGSFRNSSRMGKIFSVIKAKITAILFAVGVQGVHGLVVVVVIYGRKEEEE